MTAIAGGADKQGQSPIYVVVYDKRRISTVIGTTRFRTRCIGCDWAGAGRRAGGDFTAFVVMASDGTVCAIERFKADFALQRVKLQGLCSRFRPAAVLAEANSIGAPQISALRASGLNVQSWTATNTTKAKAVEALALWLEQCRVRIPDIENRAALLAELMAYEGVPTELDL